MLTVKSRYMILGMLLSGLIVLSIWTGSWAAPMKKAIPIQPTTKLITIQGFAFGPSTITIKPGTKVTWVNKDSMAHTVVVGNVTSPNLNPGQKWTYTFKSLGSFPYYCGVHPSMTGQVFVKK